MEISKFYRKLLRIRVNHKNKRRLNNTNFSVLSSNCVGGVMLHELGQPFLTPTINLYFSSNDYLKFLEKIEYYLGQELEQVETDKDFPVGKLDDILIYFMHYHSFEEAKQKWNERAKRINFDNLYVIMVQKEDCSPEVIHKFDALPYKNKVIFTSSEMQDVSSSYYIPGTETKDDAVIDICRYKSKFTGRRWLDDFDYVDFFNQK